MTDVKKSFFEGNLGEELYQKAKSTIDKFSMREEISKGVLVGFSGGPDSIFLLEFLLELRKREELDFKILAVHINHLIRGDEAFHDEEFSREYALLKGVEFQAVRLDVPSFAKQEHQSLEEAARNLRYATFMDIIQGRNDISTIAIAHNASDNFETVLFNMMRGAGARGLSGK